MTTIADLERIVSSPSIASSSGKGVVLPGDPPPPPGHLPRKADRVAIVGFASSSRELAPFMEDGWELWGLNHLYHAMPPGANWTRWFEIHPRTQVTRDVVREGQQFVGDSHWKWITSLPGPGRENFRPVYMQEHYDDVPASVPWPRHEINAWLREQAGVEIVNTEGRWAVMDSDAGRELGRFDDEAQAEAHASCYHSHDYWTSTISPMLGQALYEGFPEIAIYGVDLLQDEEYAYQRPGAEYLVGFGRGRGHKIYLPKSSSLCRASYVYGYTSPEEDGINHPALLKVKRHIEKQNRRTEDNRKVILAQKNGIEGGLQVLRLVERWITEGKDGKALTDALAGQRELMTRNLGAAVAHANRAEGEASAYQNSVAWIGAASRGAEIEGG